MTAGKVGGEPWTQRRGAWPEGSFLDGRIRDGHALLTPRGIDAVDMAAYSHDSSNCQGEERDPA